MARLARLDVPGCVHHVLQRGVDGRALFADATEFGRMLDELGALARVHAVAVHAYVLMPDHFHLLATPPAAGALARLMQALGRRYVRWYNLRHDRRGTLWEGRYRSTVVEPALVVDCMRFIELNPMRGALALDAQAYPWSSLAHHLGTHADPLVSDHPLYWALGNTPFERQAAYARACAQPLDAAQVDAIRAATRGGWPLGSPAFVASLQALTARRLQRRKAGRPRSRPAAAVPSGAVPATR